MKIPYTTPAPLGSQLIELAPDIVAAIHQTLDVGWEAVRDQDDLNVDVGEVFMTERLRDGMRKALKERGLPWAKMLVVLPGTESRSTPDVTIPDGRTDIPLMWIEIFVRTQEHDPHAIIECKRIAGTDTHLCREYVVEGVDRFVSGKYAANHTEGFMVGYVLTGTADESASGINKYLQRAARVPDKLQPSASLTSGKRWASQHPRSSGQPIRLHHTFLGITKHAA